MKLFDLSFLQIGEPMLTWVVAAPCLAVDPGTSQLMVQLSEWVQETIREASSLVEKRLTSLTLEKEVGVRQAWCYRCNIEG